MSIALYGYLPAWGLPCISPYVTKTANYMAMAGIGYEFESQDLAVLDDDAPTGKLPYIIDEDGTKVHDSTRITKHLQKTRGNPFDADESAKDAACATAFQRLVEENLYYWSGVIQPRWRMDVGWHTYVPYILGQPDKSYEELWPTLDEGMQGFLDSFRQRILDGFNGQGMGRRPEAEVLDFYRDDVDALSAHMGTNDFFMGSKPHTVDASVYSLLRHIMDQPHPWPG
ncbi:MAG: glutathione S-transferase C-terminal domain-containing protein, partial [Rubrobacteraceae bacterium]